MYADGISCMNKTLIFFVLVNTDVITYISIWAHCAHLRSSVYLCKLPGDYVKRPVYGLPQICTAYTWSDAPTNGETKSEYHVEQL